MVQKNLLQVLLTVGWTFLGVILLYASTWLFDRLHPIDFRREINKGNVAAGIVLAAVILAIAGILATVLAI